MNLQTTPVVMAFIAILAIGMILHGLNRDKLCLIPFCAVIVAAIAICIPRVGLILNLPVLYRYEGDIYARTGDAVIWGFFRIPHEQAYNGWVIMMMAGIICAVVAVWLIGRANICRQAEESPHITSRLKMNPTMIHADAPLPKREKVIVKLRPVRRNRPEE